MSSMIDASAWVEFFEGSERGAKVCDIVENREAATSMLTIAELADIYTRRGKPFMHTYMFIKRNSHIVDVDVLACLEAGKLKGERRRSVKSFGLMDALIYLTAQRHGLTLITKDKDFAGLAGVTVL